MSNASTIPPEEFDDLSALGRVARDGHDRRLALDVCLDGPWQTADIGRMERVDGPNWHGWRMWRGGAEGQVEV